MSDLLKKPFGKRGKVHQITPERAGLAKVLIRCLSQAVWPAKKQRQPISQIQKNLLNI